MKKNFVEDYKGRIYKIMNDGSYYLKVSPWKSGEDRRYTNFLIKRYLNKIEANTIIHEQFSEFDEEWEYMGQKYKATKCLKDYKDGWKFVYNNIPSHKDEKPFLSYYDFKLFSYKGKLVYVYAYSYYPKVPLIDLNGMFAGWTHFKWLKPIFNVSENKWA